MSTTADKTPPSASGDTSAAHPPLEMTELSSNPPTVDSAAATQQPPSSANPTTTSSTAQQPAPPASANTSSPAAADAQMPSQDTSAAPPASSSSNTAPAPEAATAAATAAATQDATEGIGPSTESPAVKGAEAPTGPVVVITLLLVSGARHPYKIDERYLRKRNVTVEKMDPFNVSVYTLKELILRDWREEWEPKPAAPSSIRLIHMGRMLEDRDKLKECRFNETAPNVVHMMIKPQEIIDDEEAAKTGKGNPSGRDGEERSTGCRCVIL